MLGGKGGRGWRGGLVGEAVGGEMASVRRVPLLGSVSVELRVRVERGWVSSYAGQRLS